MHELLTVGSIVLAIVNVGVMWAMAHQWRYAWHSNLGLQLLWLPYDYLTSQYGLLGLGVIITFVSLKGAYRENQLARRGERSQPSHRRPHRRGGTRPRVPSAPAPGAAASADTADLPAAGADANAEDHAGAEGRAGTAAHAGVTASADTAGRASGADLASGAGLAGASVSTAATDRDEDDVQQSPAPPRIPQQADRRTALDDQQSRPHFR